MKIFINNSESQLKVLFPLSWAKLLQQLLREDIPRDHGVVRILVDGVESANLLSEAIDEPVKEEIKIVEIFTKNLGAITNDGFLKAFGLLKQLREEIVKCSELFRAGDIKSGAAKLTAVMDAIKPLIQFINAIAQTYKLNYEKIPFDEQSSVAGQIEIFSQTLREIITAQEKQDFIELADILEYQLAQQMNSWQQILSKITDHIS